MEAVTDVDGQVYKIIEIGDQVWMAENLRKTTFECDSNVQVKFTNGIERGPGVAFYDGKPRYAYYQNNPNLGFGVIYSFGALQHCKLCPPGFRIPTKADWELLVSELGGKSVAGMALLPGGKSGFKAEMGGRIDAYGSGMAGSYGFWWSSEQGSIPLGNSEVYNFGVTSKGIVIISSQDSRVGIYVRCIKE
ncbi:MAG: fibrobacter succinogenes major paralogous domain-containing protein [Saprospiraceae bacterium]|nr:fibrobacter succinogenes major paralogous domain-containing protein [Saprospiraceae bacterium]MCF8249358.1 fibrobacter succinogenes major paralogous domain-containing protein [Saprospiraceae bacterium]MCF8279010.1 fibrobacter succinogenes major paralogous domain-containing protein [Bacteroidales bacterium]MCF8311487.1 fibrobacter succinogenes major paralogous domain-containing protein [Saprospiraceae bacterium]MCF8439977.1 fibrobacter succinogenes major paralogous domain-containing protein [